MNKYDKKHIANVRDYQRRIDNIYKKAVEQISMRSAGLDAPDGYIFTFDDFPALRKQIDALISKMQSDIEFTVTDGVRAEWDLANAKNDALVGTLPDALSGLAKYHRTHEDALSAFLGRKQGGLGLSENVWKYATQFKDEIEMGLDVGIRDGLDAASMARQLKQYLQFPDMLFRRVRDEHGVLHLSQRAAAFHPGQGVYRSSYKNARRLAATETNMAYRTSDHERWKDLDFIVGIEISLSNNHTCLNSKGKPVPFFDICDELQGKYPKEFKFTGWHPHCRCIATPIMKTKAELDADDERLKRGEEPSDPSTSENAVTDMPDGWKQWMEDNAERIENAKSMPYFIRDNFKDGDPSQGLRWMEKPKELTVWDIAEKRHAARTEEDVERIREAWYRRQTYQLMDDAREGLLPEASKRAIIEITDSIALGDLDDAQRRISMLQAASRRHAARTLDDISRIQDMADIRRYGQEYVDNVHKIEQELGIKRGKRMTYDEANFGKENPFYGKGTQYSVNCQTCTYVHELRRMGFDVTAMGNEKGAVSDFLKSHGMTWKDRFTINGEKGLEYRSSGMWGADKGYRTMTEKRLREYFTEIMADDGRYEVYCCWKSGSAHVFMCEVKNGKMMFFDPQTGAQDASSYIKRMKANFVSVERIDDKLLSSRFLPRVIPAKK